MTWGSLLEKNKSSDWDRDLGGTPGEVSQRAVCFCPGRVIFVDWLDHKESGEMSGKQCKDLAVPAWFLSTIDFSATAQKTTKITGICIQIIKDVVDWLETTWGFFCNCSHTYCERTVGWADFQCNYLIVILISHLQASTKAPRTEKN